MRVRALEKHETPLSIRWLWTVMTRQFGKMLTPFRVMAHSPRVVVGFTVANVALEGLKLIPAGLKRLVCLRAAQLIGCPF